jgi:replicative DNA helicase
MQWERFNFSSDFQDAIIAALITYPEEFYCFGEIIQPDFFTSSVAAREVVFWLKVYVKKYGSYPNFTTLANYVHTQAKRRMGEKAGELVEYVMNLSEIDVTDWQAIRDLSIDFAKERAVNCAMLKIMTARKEGHEINAVAEMQAAIDVGVNYSDLGVHLYHDLEMVVNKVGATDYGVHTGYPELDAIWKTGWAAGQLICLLAPPKRFKTTFAINLALNIAGQRTNGSDVLYYACEINQELAMMRAICNLSNQQLDDVFVSGTEKFIRIAKSAIARRIPHHVWFKGFPSKTATIADIKANAKQVIQRFGIQPRAIVVDYAETVRPAASTNQREADWRKQADIYTEARAMGAELGCCVIMPDRCNKDTVDKKVPSMASFQGSFEKAGIVDVALGLCATEAEHLQHKIRYFIFLNRNGAQYLHFAGKVDPLTYRMTVDTAIDYDPDAEEEPKRRKKKTLMVPDADITQQPSC